MRCDGIYQCQNLDVFKSCNNVANCTDNSDEANCKSQTVQTTLMRPIVSHPYHNTVKRNIFDLT